MDDQRFSKGIRKYKTFIMQIIKRQTLHPTKSKKLLIIIALLSFKTKIFKMKNKTR